jgi:hypothetical protein
VLFRSPALKGSVEGGKLVAKDPSNGVTVTLEPSGSNLVLSATGSSMMLKLTRQ